MKILMFVLALVGADQVSKWWFQSEFEGPWELWSGVGFKVSENAGIAFSLPVPTWVTIPLTLLVALYLGYLIWKTPQRALTRFALALVLAGALGNLIDRVFLGAVTDFISVYNFPVFNLADSFISVGVVCYVWQEVFAG